MTVILRIYKGNTIKLLNGFLFFKVAIPISDLHLFSTEEIVSELFNFSSMRTNLTGHNNK